MVLIRLFGDVGEIVNNLRDKLLACFLMFMVLPRCAVWCYAVAIVYSTEMFTKIRLLH